MANHTEDLASNMAAEAAQVASQVSAEIMEGVVPATEAPATATATACPVVDVREVKFGFTALSGESIAELTAPLSASIREVKDMLVQRGVNKTARRMHFIPANGDGEEWMVNSRHVSDYLPADHNLEATFNLLLLDSKPLDANVALHSLGASIRGEEETGANKPLIQHDRAFPVDEFGDELLSLDATNTDDPAVGIPPDFALGSELHGQFRRQNPAWDGDCDVSWFLGPAGQLEVAFPGKGALLQSVGFTYCPWDRNYGDRCEIYGKRGEEKVEFGDVSIPMHRERGDPSREKVKSIFLAVPTEHQGIPFQSLVFNWGRYAQGRRLYFLYALGSVLE